MSFQFLRHLHKSVYASRLAVLVQEILPELRPGDSVLDVGCGGGALGRALLDAPNSPKPLAIRGVETVPRPGALIEVDAYDGSTLPYPDANFDVVIIADVLHHERDPDHLIAECARVARRILIIKDHKSDHILAWPRVALMDWAANAPYGVPCLYRYNSRRQWSDWLQKHNLKILRECTRMRLYPQPYEAIFGGPLQYLAVVAVPDRTASTPATASAHHSTV